MLSFRKISIATVLATTVAFPAAAITPEEVVARLTSEGYTEIEVKTTLLGRTKIEGKKGNTEYEIVLNARGDVLREETEVEDEEDEEDDEDDNENELEDEEDEEDDEEDEEDEEDDDEEDEEDDESDDEEDDEEDDS